MRTMNLRDANQQFSKLVREVEETGETILVLRNGKPAIKLSAVTSRSATPEQQTEAKQQPMGPDRAFTFPDDGRFERDENHEDARLTRRVDANEVDSRLIAQIERTGETIEILRDGKPTAELRPSPQKSGVPVPTPGQRAALESMFETARRAKPSKGRRLTRDELHER